MADQKDTSPLTITVDIVLAIIILGIGYILVKLGF
jgi:hypothetical protein